MSITEYIISAFRCLSASKMRTFLTTLGIIVGISSVILINTIGGTIGQTISSSMGSMVQGNLMELGLVDKDANTSSLMEIAMLEMPDEPIDNSALKEYEKMMGDTLKDYSQEYVGEGCFKSNDNKKANVNLLSGSYSYIKSASPEIVSGRMLSELDYEKAVPSVVISDKAAKKLFGKIEDAIGKQINLDDTHTQFDGREFAVVGVYKYDDMMDMMMYGTSADEDEDRQTNAYVSSAYLHNNSIINTDEENYMIIYEIDESADTEEVRKMTEDFFAPYYEGTDYKMFVYMLTDQMDQINSVIDIITKVIAAIAAISLLVGGIGVMNIMLVSVSERTMEIGVRKAMGADNKSIRMQFIVESIVLALIGSVLGIVLGLVEAKLMALLISSLSRNIGVVIDLSVPVPAVIGSVIFSFAVGLIFGVYPAEKAAKMEVVDALRYE